MDLCEYQKRARDTAIYLEIDNTKMLYPALGIIGECGEVAEKVKKLIRDDNGNMTPERKTAIAKELGDCCWYLANICCDTNLDLDMVYKMKGFSLTHQIRKLTFPQLVLHMNKYASIVAEILQEWHYVHKCHHNESFRFVHLPLHLSHIIVCIEEIARRCDFTLEDVYTTNIAKLADRKRRNVIKGSGDTR